MSCPFPGMDPYLEMQPYWGDFSPAFVTEMRNALLRMLLPRYDVRLEEYLLVMRDEQRQRRVQPDVTVAATDEWGPGAGGAATAVADATSVEVEYPEFDPHKQRRLAIIRQPDQQVVTVMELLSAVNKSPGREGMDAYLEKRGELIASQISLIEFDLLRGGQRLPMRGALPAADYYVLIGRTAQRPRCQVIHWPLAAKLPKIPIPLAPDDEDAELDLSQVFHRAYEAGLYDRRLPYHQPLQPAPTKAAQKWIQQRLETRG